jgi:S-DNA-T family DNA segregation ATPase FtsK/SpoIIIE
MTRISFDRQERALPPEALTPDDIPLWTHPSPERLRAIAASRHRLWERRVHDPDFLMIRLGLRTDSSRPGLRPVLADLRGAGVVILSGPMSRVRSLARAMVSQVAVLQAPGDVDLMVAAAAEADWAWAKWLPHAHDRGATAAGRHGDAEVRPMVAAQPGDLAGLIENRVGSAAGPGHLIVVLDSYAPGHDWAWSPAFAALFEQSGPASAITVVCLMPDGAASASGQDSLLAACRPAGDWLRIRLDAEGLMRLSRDDDPPDGPPDVADQADAGLAELTARALAPLRPSGSGQAQANQPEKVSGRDTAPGLGPRFDDFEPSTAWSRSDGDRPLDVPVGLDHAGDPVLLDLSEPAPGGHGAHGLLAAASSQRRHELLRSFITGLAIKHPPERVNLLLSDSRDDAGFGGLAELPHVAGVASGLAGHPLLIRRLAAVLDAERERRAGWHQGQPAPPLPRLVVVIDDFWELSARHPEVIPLIQRLAAHQQNTGLHLLISARRLDSAWLTPLAPYLSYRIALRTASAQQSTLAIGTDDAYELPSDAGLALLATGQSDPRLLRTARLDDPPLSPPPDRSGQTSLVLPFEPLRGYQRPVPAGSLADAIIAKARRAARPARQIWLPPLPSVIPLDAVLGPPGPVLRRGWQAGMWPGLGSLAFPVALVDQPASQRQEPLLLDFAAAPGPLAIAGSQGAGKSTLLRTLMMSAMLTHTPDEVRFLCIDRGGGSLLPMAAAPQVGGIAGAGDSALAGRLLEEMLSLIDVRERGDGQGFAGAVFVLIDGWPALRSELAGADAIVSDLAARGPRAGVHLVLTAGRPADLPLMPSGSTRLELRLSDPAESLVSAELASGIGAHQAGRGLTADGQLFQVLVPRTDGQITLDDLAAAEERVLASMASTYASRG